MPEPLDIQIKLAAMAASAALPLLLLASMLPRPLVLPTLCLVAIAGAGVASFVAWRRNAATDSRNVTAWDVAGALAFVGCAAAIMSNPEQMILLAENATTQKVIR